MLRSVRYGLYGTVLAGLLALPATWNSVDKTVELVVDGRSQVVHTTAMDVGQVLASKGYRVSGHDLLAPAASARVTDGTRIVLRRGRLLHLDVDGRHLDVWTTAPTVAEALGELGFSARDFVSVSRARRLPLGATDIAIRTPRVVTIVHDGRRQRVATTDATIGALFGDLGITLGPRDRVSVPPTAPVRAGQVVTIKRVTTRLVNRVSPVPFPVTRPGDPTMYVGSTKVIKPGKKGRARLTYSVVYVDGKVVGRTLLRRLVLTRPVRETEKVGTKQRPRPRLALAPRAPAPSPGTAKAIARTLLVKRGWGSAQYYCLVALWNRESGWNVHSANPDGAYGIPQALPGSKMASAGPDWQDDATTQIKWGLGYISGRYGSPCAAWSFFQNGGWY